jgi:citrate lyase subunit beta/citryl-CoA lyase
MRSLLFVPADRPERFEKALAAGADAVIVDLEDAVAPDAKASARSRLAAHAEIHARILVRINAPGTPWHEDDLALLRRFGVLGGIVLPKAEQPCDVIRCATVSKVWPLVETALGLESAVEIGKVSGVQQLIFGTIDFQHDLNIRDDDHGLGFFRSQIVWRSRLAGLPPPIDGVCLALDDEARLDADCLRARGMGFGGKLCLHPRQVRAVNRAFSASDAERTWARRVLAASAQAHGAAVRSDGQMIDRPVVLRAEAILKEPEERGIP